MSTFSAHTLRSPGQTRLPVVEFNRRITQANANLGNLDSGDPVSDEILQLSLHNQGHETSP
jgi:hypothetical protein